MAAAIRAQPGSTDGDLKQILMTESLEKLTGDLVSLARFKPGLKQALLDAWSIEAEVGNFLADLVKSGCKGSTDMDASEALFPEVGGDRHSSFDSGETAIPTDLRSNKSGSLDTAETTISADLCSNRSGSLDIAEVADEDGTSDLDNVSTAPGDVDELPSLPFGLRPPPGLEDLAGMYEPLPFSMHGFPGRYPAPGFLQDGPLARIAQTAEGAPTEAVDLACQAADKSAKLKRTLLVTKFPRISTESDLLDAFCHTAANESYYATNAVIKREATGASKCWALVEFMDQAHAQAALVRCARGSVVLDDDDGKPWHLKAERALHATVDSVVSRTGRHRRRGTRGKKSQVPRETSPDSAHDVAAVAPASSGSKYPTPVGAPPKFQQQHKHVGGPVGGAHNTQHPTHKAMPPHMAHLAFMAASMAQTAHLQNVMPFGPHTFS